MWRAVGIVQQGHVRKVLVMDASNIGHVIQKGDCLGHERVPFDGHALLPAAPPIDDAPLVDPPRPGRRSVPA